jgi:hypothetical protein
MNPLMGFSHEIPILATIRQIFNSEKLLLKREEKKKGDSDAAISTLEWRQRSLKI